MIKDEEKLMTALEVAERLGITRGHVYRMIERGDLRAYRLGKKLIRFYPSDVDDFIKKTNKSKQRRAEKKGE